MPPLLVQEANNEQVCTLYADKLSYVVLSFNSPTERANFMEMFGYGFDERYIDGNEFMNRIEFGVE